MGDRRHRLRPDFEAEPDRDRVERERQRLGQRDRAEIFAVVVLRVPAADRDRRVFAHRVGRVAMFERREIDERLERRAGLALGGDGAVEPWGQLRGRAGRRLY